MVLFHKRIYLNLLLVEFILQLSVVLVHILLHLLNAPFFIGSDLLVKFFLYFPKLV